MKDKNFKIPTPRMPTEEEMIASAKLWWEPLEPVSFTAYNDDLKKETFSFDLIKLDPEWMKAVCNIHSEAECDKLCEVIHEDIKKLLIKYNGRIFVKLISRSPKDYLSDINGSAPKPIYSTKEVVKSLALSMRTFEDMVSLYHLPDVAYLIVRPYYDLDISREYRVIIKDKSVVGISQYYYTQEFPELSKYVDYDRKEALSFIYDRVIPNIKVDNFIADVVFMKGQIWLIETNPWGLSDPCLFKRYDNFNNTFRYLKDGQMVCDSLYKDQEGWYDGNVV